jgi:serine/threonine protein kinase
LDWDALPAADWRYEVLGEIGRGGMAVIALARDRLLGRKVALKVLADPRHHDRFRREAFIHAHLLHPAIPPLFDAGRFADGRCFLALRHVRGESLDRAVTGSPADAADLRRRLGWFEQVCRAVEYAHGKGVLHRDLKPANVLVGTFDRAYLLDWGLAKVRGGPDVPEDDPLTADGAAVGTLGYMPPEVVARGIGRADERTDVFGLGGVLCGLLTGRPVYDGAVGEVTRSARDGDTAAAVGRVRAAGVPPRVAELAERCLARRPVDRPASAGEVARAVAAARGVSGSG